MNRTLSVRYLPVEERFPIYAHTLPGEPPEEWETLDVHSFRVAALARQFAEAFSAGDWGAILGQWHDLGKGSSEFQSYLHRTSDPDAGEEQSAGPKIDHSTYGARHAFATLPGLAGQLLAFCIAGHHAGLADAMPLDDGTARSTLTYRLDDTVYKIKAVALPGGLPKPAPLRLPWSAREERNVGFAIAFFARMLFSSLIDADRTATEEFCNPLQAAKRQRPKPALAELRSRLDEYLSEKGKTARKANVNVVRASILSACLTQSSLPLGFFSLNVPTGGGKTLSSLAFALHHARQHLSLRRVVVAIPFTSIIEQTADVYRQALGPLANAGLVEHHSNLNPKRDTRRNKLSTENWNAPLIITTNIQLFESLFSSATSAARKLHRLANSVIILDEAQTIPVDLLQPTLAALRELVAHYGCSVVLCTATQPALEYRPADFSIGLQNVRPIIQDPAALHNDLKRVEVIRLGKISDEALVERLRHENQVLCVVNTKAHAAKLFDMLQADLGDHAGCYHLSTFMCAQHRRDILSEIRQRLAEGMSCRIISTQLIEAGVDIDLPVVYRAAAGFDSIAQAAGRCNREGKLADALGNLLLGKVYVFDSEHLPPPGMLRNAAQIGSELAGLHPDPLAPPAIDAYFKLLYWSRSHEWDKHEVMSCFRYDPYQPEHKKLAPLRFRTAAEAYTIIRDVQTPILVPYDDASAAMVAHVLAGKPIDFSFYRKMQPYTVSVRDDLLQKIAKNSVLVQHPDGLWALANDHAYSQHKGLLPNAVGLGPDALVL
jgi:CRISPR-associated endonuclease/helicase Cas3